MNINFLFQGRVRSLDLKKPMRTGSESKYNFKRVLELKGDGSRDSRKKGRPPGIVSSKAPSSHLASEIHVNNLPTSSLEVLVVCICCIYFYWTTENCIVNFLRRHLFCLFNWGLSIFRDWFLFHKANY